MRIRKTLNALLKEIIQEAETNPAFRHRLEIALELGERKKLDRSDDKTTEAGSPQLKRSSNRRPPALIDPVHLAKQSESTLRSALATLDLEQLRDVVADYGMDTGKLVLKWRDTERIIERIVEIARGRAQKGNAFLEQTADDANRPLDQSKTEKPENE